MQTGQMPRPHSCGETNKSARNNKVPLRSSGKWASPCYAGRKSSREVPLYLMLECENWDSLFEEWLSWEWATTGVPQNRSFQFSGIMAAEWLHRALNVRIWTRPGMTHIRVPGNDWYQSAWEWVSFGMPQNRNKTFSGNGRGLTTRDMEREKRGLLLDCWKWTSVMLEKMKFYKFINLIFYLHIERKPNMYVPI